MLQELTALESQARRELEACSTPQDLAAWNSAFLGDKGQLTLQLKKVGGLPREERPAFGQAVNRIKSELASLKESRQELLKRQELERSLKADGLDVTLSGRPVRRGRLHVATQMMRLITRTLTMEREFTMTDRFERVCGQMGEMTVTGSCGSRIGPPAERL